MPVVAIAALLLISGSAATSQANSTAGPPAGPARQPADGGGFAMPAGAGPAASGTSGAASAASTHTLATAAATGATGVVTLGPGDRGIPDRVLTAYHKAAERTARERPGCHLTWPLLAGIGKVESGHAAGHAISTDGTIAPSIIGLPLDGNDGRALILDTDDGDWDGDKLFDRAVGPMQFIPSTWRVSGRDGNNDGTRDPNNIDDAALATAGYLCAYNRDLTNPAQLQSAVLAYNPSDDYVRAVLAWTDGYDDSGAAPLLTPSGAPAPTPSGAPAPAPTIMVTQAPQPPGTPTPTPSAACPAIAVGTATLAATPINLDDTVAGYEALDVTGVLTTTGTAPVTAAVDAQLSDSHRWTITSIRTVVTADTATVAAPRQLARFDGQAIGEAGADGALTVTVTVTPEPDGAGCTPPPATAFDVSGLNAADFVGWTTTPARLRARLADYTQSGQVEQATADALGALIPATVTGPGTLTPFLDRLRSTTSAQVSDEARTRLTSIAGRLNDQQTQNTPSPAPAATPNPTPTPAPAPTPASGAPNPATVSTGPASTSASTSTAPAVIAAAPSPTSTQPPTAPPPA